MKQITEDVRSQIIQEAERLFAAYGFQKTTMDDIAGSMHKKKSSLYYYFKSKEEVFRAVLEKETLVIIDSVSRAVEQVAAPEDKLKIYILESTRQFRQRAAYYQVVRTDVFNHIEFVSNLRSYFEREEINLVERILSDGIREKHFDIEDVSFAARAIIIGLKSLQIELVMGNLTEAILPNLERMIDVLLYGIVKR